MPLNGMVNIRQSPQIHTGRHGLASQAVKCTVHSHTKHGLLVCLETYELYCSFE